MLPLNTPFLQPFSLIYRFMPSPTTSILYLLRLLLWEMLLRDI